MTHPSRRQHTLSVEATRSTLRLCTERDHQCLHCTALAAVSRPIVTRRHVRSTTMHGARSGGGRTGSCLPGVNGDSLSNLHAQKQSVPCRAIQGQGAKKSGQLPPGRSRRKLGEEQKSCLGVVRPAGVETLTGRPPERVAGNRVHAAQREHRSTDGERWDEAGLDRT